MNGLLPILVISCYRTNYPKLSDLKRQPLCLLPRYCFLDVDSSTGSSAGLFWSHPKDGWNWRRGETSPYPRKQADRLSLSSLHAGDMVSLCGSWGSPKEIQNGNQQAFVRPSSVN